MLDSLFDFLNNLITPMKELIDDFNTSEEERLELKKAIYDIETKATLKFTELQLEAAKLNAELIKSTNRDGNWLQKSWRPILMLAFGSIIILQWLGIVVADIPLWVGETIKWSLGITIAGRSIEKSSDSFKILFGGKNAGTS